MEIHEIKQALTHFKKQRDELSRLLDVETLKQSIENLEAKTYDNAFWDDHKNAQKTIKTLKALKKRLFSYEQFADQIENIELALELLEIGEEASDIETIIKETSKQLETFETMLFLSEDYDTLDAIVEFHPGAGGTESQDWALMLYRMFKRYAEKKGFTFEIIDYQDASEAGLKSATISIKGEFAYGLLKAENGVHRLVRISPFDASGRRHTSFAAVNVVPQIDDTIEIEINDSDLKIDTYRSSGAGGQSVNTTDSAVRITHKPSGIVVTCQNERSQIQNREQALTILKGKLYQKELERKHETLNELKTSDANAFGSQIRSYVMHPYNMVKDHRTNHETSQVETVLDGDLDPFIHAFFKWRMQAAKSWEKP